MLFYFFLILDGTLGKVLKTEEDTKNYLDNWSFRMKQSKKILALVLEAMNPLDNRDINLKHKLKKGNSKGLKLDKYKHKRNKKTGY